MTEAEQRAAELMNFAGSRVASMEDIREEVCDPFYDDMDDGYIIECPNDKYARR